MAENSLSNVLGSTGDVASAPQKLPPKSSDGLSQRSAPTPPKKTLDQHWEDYSKAKTPANLNNMLNEARPVLDSAITSYGGGNKNLYGHAKILAAKAIDSYDPSRGAKLQTHLMVQLQPLSRLHAEASASVKIPERVRADLYRVNQETQNLVDDLGREPSDQELADRTGMSLRRIGHVRKFARSEVSESGLTSTTEEGDEEIFYPGVQTNKPLDVWIEYVHHDLSPIDQKIFEWKYGYNNQRQLSTTEVAKRLGLSPGAISQRAAKISARINEGRELMQDGN